MTGMISKLEIYRTASVLIREHGEDAAIKAGQWADAMLERSDRDGYATWRRILWAVEEIQRTAQSDGETTH